ncbi:hypothetical protein [Bifidobacterium vespertilionis]|uniref:hypothetical protein n=1 Tax=Bifidobacterium vespertilionis TaxID=2562524 RepID=UPI001BDD94F4|nr:hypothetical protein [Bifidobacterium vespertilionis]MBT1179682.1 hypothetical protein [Bifidobacterium vespertilionis]
MMHELLEWATSTSAPVWSVAVALFVGIFARELTEAWNHDRERERAMRGGENHDATD